MIGYIKLHRGWHDSNLFRDNAPYCERAAWCWLLSNAAWKDVQRIGPQGNTILVREGEFHTSLRSLAKAWNWDKMRVSRFIKRAEKCQNIETTTGQAGLHISICNWGEYQRETDKRETTTETSERQARDTQEEGIRRDKKKEPPIIPQKGKSDLPKFTVPDWIPTDAWQGFETMRKAARRPLTDRARQGIINKLAKMRGPPGEILDQSTENGWYGVFELKGTDNGGNDRQRNSNAKTGDGFNDVLRDIASRSPDEFASPDERPMRSAKVISIGFTK
jgi:hypothetical protein